MKEERQAQKQEEMRKTILDAARQIVADQGVQGLSIRKITKAIGYSPAIVYHYFQDKNEIVESLVTEGYQQIVASIRSVPRNEAEPEKELKEVFTKYIKAALDSPDEYQAFLLNEDPSVLKKTALLQRGISQHSQSLHMLCDNIQRGISLGRYAPCDIELTAQIIWTSTFGLIIKLMMEKEVSEEQVERLIDHHFALLFNGILI